VWHTTPVRGLSSVRGWTASSCISTAHAARPGSQNLGDANLTGTNWSLLWQPTRFNHVQHHNLWVYAHSSVTGEEALVTEELDLSR